jgi:hypothetical protein
MFEVFQCLRGSAATYAKVSRGLLDRQSHLRRTSPVDTFFHRIALEQGGEQYPIKAKSTFSLRGHTACSLGIIPGAATPHQIWKSIHDSNYKAKDILTAIGALQYFSY